MKITPQELDKFRADVYLAKNSKNHLEQPRLLRTLVDDLSLAISCLESPHPNDESLANALQMLFMAVHTDSKTYSIKDRQLFIYAMDHLHKVLLNYKPKDAL